MRLLPVEEVVDRLGIKRAKLYQIMMAGELKSVTIGRRRLVPDREIDIYIERLLAEQGAADGGD